MITALATQIKSVGAQATGITVDEVSRRLVKPHRSPGNHLIIAPAARQFWVQLRQAEPKSLHERVLVENWKREFQWSDGDGVEDPVENWEIENWAYAQYELQPGEVTAFLARQDAASPYENEKDNTAFRAAQRGGIPQESDGTDPFMEDNERDREPEGWPEYMQPVGLIDLYTSDAWQHMHDATQWAINLTKDWVQLIMWADAHQELQREELDPGDYVPEGILVYADIIKKSGGLPGFTDNLKAERLCTWDMVRVLIREDVESAWIDAVRSYTERQMDVVALALAAHRLTSCTRFNAEEMMERASAIQWRSHADDRTILGILSDFLVEYKDELDEIEEDLSSIGSVAPEPWEEQKMIDTWAQTYENSMQKFWKTQFNQPGDCFAARWTGEGDIRYSVAYRAAILDGQDGMDAHQQALEARRGG